MPKALSRQDGRSDKTAPTSGELVCIAGPYTVTFRENAAWTIKSMVYDGHVFGVPTGCYGTVLIPAGDKWWGTGHSEGGREVVHSITLRTDNRERSIEGNGIVSGERIVLTKESTIWGFRVLAETVVTPDHIYERTRMTATEDLTLARLYYFMHSFSPRTTTWAAEMADGAIETGQFDYSDGFRVNKETRWAAECDSEQHLGMVAYTPKVIRGSGSLTKIWDREIYHKMYHQHNETERFSAGQTLDYAVVIKAVGNENGDWAAIKDAVASLKQAYPPQPDGTN